MNPGIRMIAVIDAICCSGTCWAASNWGTVIRVTDPEAPSGKNPSPITQVGGSCRCVAIQRPPPHPARNRSPPATASGHDAAAWLSNPRGP